MRHLKAAIQDLGDQRLFRVVCPAHPIIGPLLFIIFFNDLADIVNVNIIKYADDTVLFYSNNNADQIELTLNNEMDRVGKFCLNNELLLNLKKGKTEAMLFGTSKRLKSKGKKLNILYNGSGISFVHEYVYLGNTLDANLTLDSNFNRCYKLASSRIRLLQRICKLLNVEAATMIFNMMILPLLTYSGPVKSVFTRTQTERLFSLTRRAREVTNNDNVKDVFQEINKQNCMLVLKCLNGQTGSFQFNKYFEMQNHSRNTRNNKYIIKLKAVKLEVARQSFYFNGAKLFNSLPREIRVKYSSPEIRSCLSIYNSF